MPVLQRKQSRPEVAAVEDLDEDGNLIEGTGRYARSTAAPSPPPADSSLKALMNTSKKKSSSSRRPSVHQYEYDTDIMPSPESPPAATRRESKPEKRRPSISTKQPKGVVVDQSKTKRPVPRSSKTMPFPPGHPSESAFYGVPTQTMPASSRPRAQSYYSHGPGMLGMPGMPGMPGGPGRPPLSNSAMYYGPPPGAMGPPGFPPGPFHGAGGPGMPPMGPPPPHMMMAQSPMSAGPGPMPSPGGYFPPSGPETLASRFHRGQEHRPRSAMGFQGSPGHYEDFGDYMEEPAQAPVPRGGLVRRQSVSQAPPKRQPKEIEAPRDMGPPAPPRRPQTARPQSMSLPYRPQPLSIMKSAHFHEDDVDEDNGFMGHPNPKRASGHGFESYEYGKSTVARRHHRHPSYDDSLESDEDEALYQREPAAAPERRGASAYDKHLRKAMKYQSEVAGPAAPMVADTQAHTAALTHDALRRRNGADSRSSHSSDSHDESSYKQSAATRTTRDSDDGINVKVSGDATVEIGNTKINFSGGGGEMTIGRGNNNNGGSDRGTDRGTEYGGDDRKSRADRTERPSRARAQSQAGSSYPRSHYDPNMPPGYGAYPSHLPHHPSQQRPPHHAMQYAPPYSAHPGYAAAPSEYGGDYEDYEHYYSRH